jgi:hypothetical protein
LPIEPCAAFDFAPRSLRLEAASGMRVESLDLLPPLGLAELD